MDRYLKDELKQKGAGIVSLQQCATLASHIGSDQFVFCDKPTSLPSCAIPKTSCKTFVNADVSPMCQVVFSKDLRAAKREPAKWNLLSNGLTKQGVAVADSLKAGDELRLDVSGCTFSKSGLEFNLTTPDQKKIGADIFSFKMNGRSLELTNYRKTGRPPNLSAWTHMFCLCCSLCWRVECLSKFRR